DMALSTQVYNADLWQARLATAWETAGDVKNDTQAAKLCNLILRWNRRADADSTGATAYFFWKNLVSAKALQSGRAGKPPPADVTDTQLLSGLVMGAEALHKKWGRLDVAYGEVFRVGRRGGAKTWPVGGGSMLGMATPRAIGFEPGADGKTFVGRGGQTS